MNRLTKFHTPYTNGMGTQDESVIIMGVTSRGSALCRHSRTEERGSEDRSYQLSLLGAQCSGIVILFPVGVVIVAGHPTMLWPIRLEQVPVAI